MKRQKGEDTTPGKGVRQGWHRQVQKGSGWGSGVLAHRNERNAKTLRAALLKPTPALWNAIQSREEQRPPW